MSNQLRSSRFQKAAWNATEYLRNELSCGSHENCEKQVLFVKQSQDYIPVDFPWSNTHEELQYIQLSINNESAASLALHQLWRGKPRCTVLLEGEKKPYPAHERCVRLHVACIMCLCAQVWEEEHKFTPLINNKPACVGGLCGWFSLHIVSLVVLAQIFPCLTFDALLFFGWLCIDFQWE